MQAPAAGGGRREPAISAAVENCKDQRKPAAVFGHRKADQSFPRNHKIETHLFGESLFFMFLREVIVRVLSGL